MKLAAAQRQIDAAIRMLFLGEDELAIYTVAAAAHGILRDVMRKRGRSSAAEAVRDGIRGVANALAAGTLSDKERAAFEGTQLWPVIVALKKKTESTGDDSLPITAGDGTEGRYWKLLSHAANFLKHADRDSSASIGLDEINVDAMLNAVCMAYVQLTGRPTPEMNALWIYSCVADGRVQLLPKQLQPIALQLARIDKGRRLSACADVVRKLKTGPLTGPLASPP